MCNAQSDHLALGLARLGLQHSRQEGKVDLLQADYFREWSWVRSLHPVHSRLPLTTAVLKALGGVGEGWKPATMKWKPDGTWPADMTPAHVKTTAQAEAAMEALVADGGQAAQPVREEEAALRQARRVFYAARAGVGAAAAPAAAAEPAPGPREAAAGPAPAQEPGAAAMRFLGGEWEDPEDQVDAEAEAAEAAAAAAPAAPAAPAAAAAAPVEQAAARPRRNAVGRPKDPDDWPVHGPNGSFRELTGQKAAEEVAQAATPLAARAVAAARRRQQLAAKKRRVESLQKQLATLAAVREKLQAELDAAEEHAAAEAAPYKPRRPGASTLENPSDSLEPSLDRRGGSRKTSDTPL